MDCLDGQIPMNQIKNANPNTQIKQKNQASENKSSYAIKVIRVDIFLGEALCWVWLSQCLTSMPRETHVELVAGRSGQYIIHVEYASLHGESR